MKRTKRNVPDYSLVAPLLMWNSLAVKTAETMMASAEVISHRTGRMAAAGAKPSARDRREFARMGQEKIEAGTQSMFAMGMQMMMLGQPLGEQLLNDMMRGTTAFMALANSRTPQEMNARQARLAKEIERSAVSMAQASKIASNIAHDGLKPIHAKVTANAKRLGRR